jgi:predicted RND superfamily exporter protein
MMSYTWKRAVRAMMVTSSTTSAAFMANFFSPLMPIKAFGMYAAIIVPANYFLVVLFYPPALITYERHIEGKYCVKWCSRKKKQDVSVTKITPFEQDDDQYKFGKVELFFGGPWNRTIYNLRWFIIIIFMVWAIFASICSSYLRPLTSAEEYLPKEHPMQKTLDLVNEKLSYGGSSAINV